MTHRAINRRMVAMGALAGLATVAGGTRRLAAAAAAVTPGGPVTILEPFGGLTVANSTMMLLAAPIERQIGRRIELVPVSDGSRTVATIIDRLNDAPADGSVLGVLALLSSAMGDLYDEKARLASLVPIAKLTRGWSEALFVAAGSRLAAWSDFAAAASRETLKVATFDRSTVSYLTVMMLKRYAGIAVESVVTRSVAETIDAVRSGAVTAGVVPTPSLLPLDGALRPLVTFGAARNAALATVPAFAELVHDRHADFTESLAVFAPGRTAPEVVAPWTTAFEAAGRAPSIRSEADAKHLGLAVQGPDLVRETMARNTRLLRAMFKR